MTKFKFLIKNGKSCKNGDILISVLVFSAIAITVTIALVNWAATVLKTTRLLQVREQAFQIAEAGIDYYRWHLAHAQSDYQDGTGVAGPYVHDFTDASGNIIGQFSLNITPPPIGSTIVKIKSTGTVSSNPSVKRSILATMAIPSLAKFAVVANDNMRFGAGTEVFGPVQSNGGIRFDGLAHNLISSSETTYTDPDTGLTEFGVYTTVTPQDPQPPAAVPYRPDVFMAGRQFPVPAFDFTGLTVDLSQIKANAQSGGEYFSSSGKQGYHIILKTNDTFDLYKVKSLQSASSWCSYYDNGQANWGTWSISQQQFVGNYPFPANGLIFVEDNLWIDGQINGARLTIAAGQFPDNPTTRRSITVNSNLVYTNYDGSDTLALIAQGDVNVGLNSADTLRIDGALVAQNGRVGRYYYSSYCGSNYKRTSITTDGMIATNQRYGFAYTDGTGYQTRDIIYDSNLLYGPPPSFPLTSDQYQTISWQEVSP
ncbi:hypothetical protein KGQ27_00490 [Patescibacteria group bacterium]|nr:hypothetical protein [Patescibacteria group bacterium]MDE1946691.1 hypothetical protein [Patescibacteria group bacterium]MDE2010644.1 hypothetical protein [Patescibacteria group bacterium]MDE2233316.1 hypothetical protein [Patescibacteria group bacterium]